MGTMNKVQTQSPPPEISPTVLVKDQDKQKRAKKKVEQIEEQRRKARAKKYHELDQVLESKKDD